MTKEIRKNLITLVAALAMACAATAQSKWSIVPQVGINSTVHSSNFPNWETKRGFVVGADFGLPVTIEKIRFLPRNDDNDVISGRCYELGYYADGREKSAGRQIAKDGKVSFSKIPSGTLYVLHDLEKGTEERIFTYKNNQIKWY